jgi:hypothetical protein
LARGIVAGLAATPQEHPRRGRRKLVNMGYYRTLTAVRSTISGKMLA